MKARSTASFGVPYNYSGINYERSDFPTFLTTLKSDVDNRLGFPTNNCLVNLYDTGLKTLGFHSDSIGNLDPASSIAIVSLGSVRTMVFRSKTDRAIQISYPLPAGSILIMTLETQKHWEHGIPIEPTDRPRVGLTFRRFREPAG